MEDDEHMMNLDIAREAAQQEVALLSGNLEAASGEIRLRSREIETLKVGK